MTTTAIEIDHLTKRFGSTTAVRDLSFTVEAGTITGFLGRNGAGKTTTMRTLLGLVAPTSGRATFGGVAYRDLVHPARVVGAVLEATGFHPGRRARDHLRIVAASGAIPRGRVDEVLDLVGLADAGRRRVGGFSLGMRQRLGLAAALLGDPEVLILDEPTNGLDPDGIRWVRRFVRHAADEGRTVLVSSHVLAEVAQTVDQVVIIDRGRHVTSGTVAEVTSGLRSGVRVRTAMADRLAAALAAAGHRVTRAGVDALLVDGATPEAVGRVAAATGVVVAELTALEPDLEDAFFTITARAHEEVAR